jgi:hypothetical protein
VTDHEPDLELLTRLRVADPASSLPTADPAGVADLLEAVMSDTATRTHESRETGTHDRSPLTWLVAAAAVVLIAAAGVVGLAQRGHDASTPVVQGSVTQLRYVPFSALCQVPNVGVLHQQSVAFRGTLVSMAHNTATFEVTHWYAGGPTDQASVTVAPHGIPELVSATDLAVGHDYVMSASDGVVTACGFSGPATASRLKLYDRAFG